MFWGLIMEPGKKYSQVVEKDFHIAQAALDLDSAQNSPVQVLISIDGRNYLVCTLIKDKVCQANLDLNFRAGVKVSFATNGPGHVHLTGYLIEDNEFELKEDSDDEVEEEESADEEVQVPSKKRKAQQQKIDKPNKKTKTAMMLDQLDEESYNEDDDSNVNLTDLMDESDDSDDDEAEDEEVDGEEGSDDDDDDDDNEDDDSDEEESEEEEVKQKVSPKKQQQETPKQNGVAKKTPKNDKVQKIDKSPKGGDKSPKNEKTPKGPKTPAQDKQKTPAQDKQKTPKGNKSPGGDSGTPNKKTVEGGVIIEDLKVGDGPIAKSGRNVRVYYEGRLKSNNKVFDSSNKGAGFKFRLGKEEVIKGWDVGVAGMKLGGKRRITCPPHMAYGAAGSPPVIPPNSTLVFEVELKQVN